MQVQIIEDHPTVLSTFEEYEQEIFAIYAPADEQGQRDPDMVRTIDILSRHHLYSPGDPALQEVWREQGEEIALRIMQIDGFIRANMFFMGYLLTIVEQRPEIYLAMNHPTFESWISTLNNVPKSFIVEVQLRAKVWPFMRLCGYSLVTFLQEFTDYNKIKTLYAIKRGIDAQIEANKKLITAEKHPGLPEERIPLAERNEIILQAQEECLVEVHDQIEKVRVLSTSDYIIEKNERLGKPQPLHLPLYVEWRDGILTWKAGNALCELGQVAALQKGIIINQFIYGGRVLSGHELGEILIHQVEIPGADLKTDDDDDNDGITNF
jgi:hypothetical protein